MPDTLLNINDIRHRSEVNGPGIRSVVWVQGCSRHCPGCINPHTHEHKPIKLLDPQDLGQSLAKIEDTIGITLSGGEPFEQAEACSILAETVRAASKSVMVFTGFPLYEIRESTEPMVQRFLDAIDLIVAGPYVQELKCQSKFWRASRNQTVHFLSGQAEQEAMEQQDQAPLIEVKVDGDRLTYTGFPEHEDLTWFDRIGGIFEDPLS